MTAAHETYLRPRPRRFKSGLEGHVAFRTEIAEPDKDGGALRYRGVDIEDLVGKVTFGNVWALLVDGRFGPGPAARRAVPDPGAHRRRARRRPGRAGHARAVLGLPAAAGHRRRGGPRAARPRLGDGAVLRGPVGPRHRRARGAAGPHRPVLDDHRAVHDALARRAGPGARQGGGRVLGVGRRARHERLHLHRPRDRLHRRRRGRGAVRARSARCPGPLHGGAPGPGAADAGGGRAHRGPDRRWSRASSTARRS